MRTENPTENPTDETDTTGPNRHHATEKFENSGWIRRHRTDPTDCIRLRIPGSWVRSPPALLRPKFPFS